MWSTIEMWSNLFIIELSSERSWQEQVAMTVRSPLTPNPNYRIVAEVPPREGIQSEHHSSGQVWLKRTKR